MQWRDLFGSGKQSESPALDYGAIGRVRKERNVASLAQALSGDSVLVRIAAAQALAGRQDDVARRALPGAMKDVWKSVRIVAGESLAQLVAKGAVVVHDVGDPSEDDLRTRRQAAAGFSPELVAYYVRGLGDADPAIRLAAAEVLGETGAVEAVGPLIAALKDEAWEVASEANEALVRIGNVALPPLLQALKDRNPLIRRSVAWCLGRIAHPNARESLALLLRDDDEEVRAAASQALKDLARR